MQFTYRGTLLQENSNRAINVATTIDTDEWISVVRRDASHLYGNSADLIEEHVFPLLESGDELPKLYATLLTLYKGWRLKNGTVIFELAMFVWAGFKAGKYSEEVWATVLAVAWQSGARGMMAGVKLGQGLVIEMFKAAPRHVIFEMARFKDTNLLQEFEAMSDPVGVWRGVSTGINNFEDGFSWTRDMQQAASFMAINCHTKREIPGIVYALIPKDAILAIFSFEGEVVVDPTVKKIKVEKHFLRGKELRDFQRKVAADN